MKAGIFHGLGKVSYEEIEKPEFIDGSVVVKNIRAGICGTDVRAYRIEYESVFIFPGNQFGHEMVGVVDEVDENVDFLKKGDRVYINPCTFKEPTEEMCAEACCDMAGAFSEYIRVDKPELNYNVHLLPDNISWDVGALIEPACVANHGVSLANPSAEDKVLVFGGGPIGLCALACLKARGVKDVVAVDRSDMRLGKISEIGGVPCDTKETTVHDFVMDRWGKSKGYVDEDTWNADVVIDCGGWPGIIEEVLKYAKSESTFIQVALGTSEEKISGSGLAQKGIKIFGSFAYTPEGTVDTIDIMSRSPESFEAIVTSVYGITEIAEAFEAACRQDENVKVLIDHSR